eukprot:gene7808-9611_t
MTLDLTPLPIPQYNLNTNLQLKIDKNELLNKEIDIVDLLKNQISNLTSTNTNGFNDNNDRNTLKSLFSKLISHLVSNQQYVEALVECKNVCNLISNDSKWFQMMIPKLMFLSHEYGNSINFIQNHLRSNTEENQDNINNGQIFPQISNSKGLLFSTVPKPIQTSIKFKSISCGKKHIISLSESGQVYSWGSPNFGCLGLGILPNRKEIENPTHIEQIKQVCVKIFTGVFHNCIISEEGHVFTFGKNTKGCLGYLDTDISKANRGFHEIKFYTPHFEVPPSTYKKNMSMVYNNPNFSDLTISSKNQKYHIHISMFYHICPQLVQLFGELKHKESKLEIGISIFYGLPRIESICENELSQWVSIEFLPAILEVALNRKNSQLLKHLKHFIFNNRSKSEKLNTIPDWFLSTIPINLDWEPGQYSPKMVEFEKFPLHGKIVDAGIGLNSTVVLDENGSLFQFGHVGINQIKPPTKEKIICLYGGENHFAYMTSSHQVYAWGSGFDSKIHYLPTKIETPGYPF